MVVIRDHLNNSKPCYHCLQMIHEIGIRRIVYSNDADMVATKTVCLHEEYTCADSNPYKTKGIRHAIRHIMER